jgi:hypothetical protein
MTQVIRASALQAQSPEFKSKSHQKKKKEEEIFKLKEQEDCFSIGQMSRRSL